MSPITTAIPSILTPRKSPPSVSNLYMIRDIFYFRTRIPRDLQDYFGGKQDFKRTLHTRSLKQAKRLLRVWVGRTEEVFTTMRSGALTRDQIRQLAEAYLHNTLRRHEEDRIQGNGNPQGPGELQHRLAQSADDAKFLKSALSYSLYGGYTDEVAAYLANVHGITADNESPEFKQLTRSIIQKKIEVIRVESERLQGNYENGYDDRPLSVPVVVPDAVPTAPLMEAPGLLISECIEKYVADCHRAGRARPQSIEDYAAACLLLQDYLYNKEMKAVSRDDIRAFHDALERLPANMNKKKEYRDKNIHEVLAMDIPSEERLGDTTISKLLSRVTTLLSWAEQEGILPRNPATGITHAQKPKSYLPFDNGELQGMVDGFLKVAADGDLKDKPERVWLPLLGLFTGGRVNELCQLHIGDVRQEAKSGIWFLQFEETEEDTEGGVKAKTLKNQSSCRALPIHPVLVELGFLDYYRHMKETGAPRLWMNLKQAGNTEKYNRNFTNWFLKSKMGPGFKTLFMTIETSKVFHSFRKSFSNELKQRMVAESVIKDLMGHKHGSMTLDVYTQPHRLENMLEAMRKMDFGVDFMPVKEILKSYAENTDR
jgi:integrase